VPERSREPLLLFDTITPAEFHETPQALHLEIKVFFITKGVQKRIVQVQIAADVDEIVIGHAGNKVRYDIVCGAGDFLPVFWVPITTALNRVIEVMTEYRGVGVSVQHIFYKSVIKAVQ
jgi:hypothetical protein